MVDIDPAKLQAKGVSPQDVVNALLPSNVILPAGHRAHRRHRVRRAAQLVAAEVAEFNAMPLKVVNGVPVLLGDVAYVHDGYAVQTNIVRVNGRRATYLAILRKAGASTLAVVDAVRDAAARDQGGGARGRRAAASTSISRSSCARAIKSVLREAVIAAGPGVADDPVLPRAAGARW